MWNLGFLGWLTGELLMMCFIISQWRDVCWKWRVTHWGWDTRWPSFSRRHFQLHFFSIKMYEFCLRFHWSLFLRIQLITFRFWNVLGNPTGTIMDIYRGIKRLIQYRHNSNSCTMKLPVLTYWGLVTHMCIGELGLHWSRQWLVALLAPSHHLYQGRPFSSISIEKF